MNNLALCLANQGMFDESLDTLRQALVMAPDKQEVEVRARACDLRERIGEIYGEIGDGSPALEVEPMGIWRLPGQTPALLARFGRRDGHEESRRRA